MTSSNPSKESRREFPQDGVCDHCGGPTRLRNAHPYPVRLQAAFGVSFVAFLWVQSSGKLPAKALWVWSVIQIALGALLIRARYAAAKKVFICLRCGSTLG